VLEFFQGLGNALVGTFSFVTTDETGSILIFGQYPEMLALRAAFLVVVFIIAYVAQRLIAKFIHRVLKNFDNIPSASIIVNFIRCVVWALALIVVLEPVFGIQPTAFITALGVTSVVISLGLKDTISNIFGGLMLMVGNVVQPGDYVTIAGLTGTVVDVTMRHTVVQNRLGDRIVIPNSVLNSTSVQCLPASSESQATLEFTMELGNDPDLVAEDLIKTAKLVAGDRLREDMEPRVFFDSITPYGAKGQIYFYVREGVPFAGVRNSIVRAIAKKDYFSTKGARALAEQVAEGAEEVDI
jgi:small-conductance mechanosensitive channel